MQALSVTFDAARNQAELDYQDIVDHPHEPLKDHPGNPAYDERVFWHGGDPVLAAFSVGSLHRFGAMNLRDPNDIFTVPKCSVDVDESLKNKGFEDFKKYNAALPPNSLPPDVKEGLSWRDYAVALGKSTEYYKDVIADWTIAMLPWELEDSKPFKTKPRTWDLIDRFHPGQFTIMTEPPLLNFPKYDPARSQYERRKYVRDLRKEKLREKAQKIAERRKLDKAKKGPPKRKREYDKISEALKPSAPSPTDLGRYPRANPRPKDYDSDLEFPRVPCTGNQQELPPPYNNREKWAPKGKIDFGDCGAYPETDCQQYPLGMDEYDDDDDSGSDSDGSPSPPFKMPILDY